MQDLEIYVRDLDPGKLALWLDATLDQILVPLTPLGSGEGLFKAEGRYCGALVRVSVYPGAFGKRYSSVVLEGESLPWTTDLESARSAWRALETEVRCSQGEWQEGDPVQDEKWWRLDHRGEQLVVWN